MRDATTRACLSTVRSTGATRVVESNLKKKTRTMSRKNRCCVPSTRFLSLSHRRERVSPLRSSPSDDPREYADDTVNRRGTRQGWNLEEKKLGARRRGRKLALPGTLNDTDMCMLCVCGVWVCYIRGTHITYVFTDLTVAHFTSQNVGAGEGGMKTGYIYIYICVYLSARCARARARERRRSTGGRKITLSPSCHREHDARWFARQRANFSSAKTTRRDATRLRLRTQGITSSLVAEKRQARCREKHSRF